MRYSTVDGQRGVDALLSAAASAPRPRGEAGGCDKSGAPTSVSR